MPCKEFEPKSKKDSLKIFKFFQQGAGEFKCIAEMESTDETECRVALGFPGQAGKNDGKA